MFTSLPKETLDFMVYRKLNDILSMGMIQVIPDTVKLHAILQGLMHSLQSFKRKGDNNELSEKFPLGCGKCRLPD